jgi:predicted nucleic acid-binding protein
MIANRFTAVIDACVLCSPLKRNLILPLAEAEIFRVRWSDEIMNETEKAITIILSKKDHDDAAERAAQARNIMNQAFAEATVVEYERHGSGIGRLPDEGDRHVIAAAIKSKADTIVTENLKDFPRKILADYGIKAKSSDEFIADAINLSPSLAIDAIKRMLLRLDRPEQTIEILLLDMEKTGLTRSADQLRDGVKLI